MGVTSCARVASCQTAPLDPTERQDVDLHFGVFPGVIAAPRPSGVPPDGAQGTRSPLRDQAAEGLQARRRRGPVPARPAQWLEALVDEVPLRRQGEAAVLWPIPRSQPCRGAAAIHDKADLLRDFLAREAKALDWSAAHPHEWAVALVRETGLAPEIAEQVVRKYRHAPAALDGAVAAHLDAVADRFVRAGLLKPSGRRAAEVLAPLR